MPGKERFATLMSWSFSVYTQYIKCPFSVYLDKIKRVRITEPPNPFFVKGNRSHEIAEMFISGAGKKRPALTDRITVEGISGAIKIDLRPIEAELVQLRAAKAETELEWAFDRDWNPVRWNDWDRAWLRVKTDVCANTVKPPMVDIVDWKTGKVHDEHRQQRSLYALAGLLFTKLGKLAGGSKDTKLTARHVYIDTGQTATENYVIKDLEPLKREWLARIETMMSDTSYQTKVGIHCRWCKFAKSRGGPCPEKQ